MSKLSRLIQKSFFRGRNEPVESADSRPEVPHALSYHRLNRPQIRRQGSIAWLDRPPMVAFHVLRQIANIDPLIRICINTIKRAVSCSEWKITVKDNAPGEAKDYEEEIQELELFFDFPNQNYETLRSILDQVVEDILVMDAGAIEKVWSRDKSKIMFLNSVDGATIRPRYNQYGELEEESAYVQVIDESARAEFAKDELIYMMQNPQNDVRYFGYGRSTIENIMIAVQAALEADMANVKSFKTDNIPPGMLDLGDMNEEDAQRFIMIWNATVQTNPDQMKFIWGKTDQARKFTPFKTNNRDMQFTEYLDYLARLKLAAFGLSTLDANMLQQVNYATAEVQDRLSKAKGVYDMKKLVSEYITRHIVNQFEGSDISVDSKFKWLQFVPLDNQTPEERKMQAETDAIYVQSRIKTPDEIRNREGLPPLGEDQLLYMDTMEGVDDNEYDPSLSIKPNGTEE